MAKHKDGKEIHALPAYMIRHLYTSRNDHSQHIPAAYRGGWGVAFAGLRKGPRVSSYIGIRDIGVPFESRIAGKNPRRGWERHICAAGHVVP